MTPKVNDYIHIMYMKDEPRYSGRKGIITHIDSLGNLHGSWGGLAVIPEEDDFIILNREE